MEYKYDPNDYVDDIRDSCVEGICEEIVADSLRANSLACLSEIGSWRIARWTSCNLSSR